MTKPLDLDELERVADAATEGPWEVTDGPLCPSSAVQTVGEHECSIGPRKLPIGDYGCDSHDATHIATFDPPTVRALIARVRELEAERGKLAADLLSQETQMIELEVVNANQGKSLIALISERDQLKARVRELEERLKRNLLRWNMEVILQLNEQLEAATARVAELVKQAKCIHDTWTVCEGENGDLDLCASCGYSEPYGSNP